MKKQNIRIITRIFFLICCILVLKLPMWFSRMSADGGVLAMNGISLLHGEAPYMDWWDFKLPGAPILNGVGAFLFGQTALGIRIFELLWICISILVFDKIVKRIFRLPPLSLPTFIFTLLACSWTLLRYGNTVTLWEVLPWLLALDFSLTITSSERIAVSTRYRAAFYVGLCLSSACIIRQSAALPGAVLLIALFFSQRAESGLRRTLLYAAFSFLGTALIVTALLLWLSDQGALSEALKWWKIGAVYLKAGWLPLFRAREGLITLRNTSLAFIPLFLLFLASFHRLSLRTYAYRGLLNRKLLLILIAVKFTINASGGRLYNHYFMELVPELSLLAAPFFLTLEHSFFQRKFDRHDVSRKLGLAAVGMLLVFQCVGSVLYIQRFVSYNTREEKELVAYIRGFALQEQRYFSWWGYEPLMFGLVDYRQISPLKFNWLLFDIAHANPSLADNLQKEMADRLKKEKPPVVLLTNGETSLFEIKQYAPAVLYVMQKFYFPDKYFGTYWVWKLQRP